MRHPLASPLPLALLVLLALLPAGLAAEEPPAPEPPETETPEPETPAAPAALARSVLTATIEALRSGDGGPLGEHDFLLVVKLLNPSATEVEIHAGNLMLRSAGGWLSALAPAAETDMFARTLELGPGQDQRIEPEKPYKVLGPARDVVLALKTSDGTLLAAAPVRTADEPAGPATPAPAWPLSLGVQDPLEAVPYADGRRSIVVVGQAQLHAAGTLADVQWSLVVGGDRGTSTPLTWTGGVEDGAGPQLWPFVQRVDVGEDFTKSSVSLRLRATLDGQPVAADLDLPAEPVEPFLCLGPVLDHWQLANGPAERRPHANLLQLRSRYAWDFVVLKDGQTYEGDVSSNESYLAFGKPIYAAADGEVVDLCDHQLDRSGTSGSLAPCVYTPVNRVVLEHADGTCTAYLHIQKNSARLHNIEKGTKVRAGQGIGHVGNSGASSEPHLQFFAFRREGAGGLRPVPVAFRNAFEDAKGVVPVAGVPVGGTQIHFLDRKALAERPGGAGGGPAGAPAGGGGPAGSGAR